MARVLWNEFGPGPELDETQPIEMVWASPEVRNVKEDLEAATLKKALGVPQEQLWAEMGYTEAQIEEFAENLAQEQAQQQEIGDRLLRNFERGGMTQ